MEHLKKNYIFSLGKNAFLARKVQPQSGKLIIGYTSTWSTLT